jgi:membrane protease YdiL (CAAX protease family)
MQGVMVLFIFAAGEAIYRSMFPQKLSLEATFGKAFGSKQVNKALFIGTFVGIIFFSYEVAYYFLGKQIGFWSPADINYDDIFSTAIPWVYPMFIGFIAATTEEGIFRLFGISFLKKYVKKTWIAVLITSLCWAFLHSNYPQSPWFVRGIELSVVGIVFGTLFVRYGIVASLTAHYTFNALQTAIYFSSSGNMYSIISSTIVSLLPLLIALYFLARSYQKKGFLAETKEFLNAHITTTIPVIAADVKGKITSKLVYQPLSKKRIIIISLLAIGSVIGFWKYDNVASVGQSAVAIDREEALAIAEKNITSKGVVPSDYYHVVTFVSNEDTQAEEYILEKADVKKVAEIFPDKVPTAFWSVRFFKPLQKEEYTVDILANGKLYQINHAIDEKASGANLNQNEALRIAQDYLINEKKYNLLDYKVVENTADKKEKRTDYYFEFEQKDKLVSDALYRTTVTVKGNEVAGFNQYIKLPEAWLRDKSQTSTFDFVLGTIAGITGIIIFSLGFSTFLRFTREKRIQFKTSFKLAAVAVVFSALGIINSLPTFYSAYQTSIPLSSFAIQSILISFLGLVIGFFAMSLLIGQFGALWKFTFGGFFPQEKLDKEAYVRDGIIAAYLVPFLLSGVSIILLYLSISRDSLQTVSTYNIIPGLDTYLPLLSTILPIPALLIATSFVGSLVLLLYKYLKQWKYVLLFFLFFIILSALSGQEGITDFALALAESLVIFGGFCLIVAFVLRKNLLAYGLLVYISILLATGLGFIEQEKSFYILNGVILLFLAILPLLVYFIRKYILHIWRVWFRLK